VDRVVELGDVDDTRGEDDVDDAVAVMEEVVVVFGNIVPSVNTILDSQY